MRHLFELFLFFIVLMALPDWYIYRHYIRHWKNKWMRLSYWIPSVSLLTAMGYIFGGFAPESSLSALGVFLVVFLCINVPKALFSILMPLVKKNSHRIGHCSTDHGLSDFWCNRRETVFSSQGNNH